MWLKSPNWPSFPGDAEQEQLKGLEAKTKLLNQLQSKLKTGQTQLNNLRTKNTTLLETLTRLIPDGHSAVEDSIRGAFPRTEGDVDNYIQELHRERRKLEKLVYKVEQRVMSIVE